jgi:hypothetical protein
LLRHLEDRLFLKTRPYYDRRPAYLGLEEPICGTRTHLSIPWNQPTWIAQTWFPLLDPTHLGAELAESYGTIAVLQT